MKRVAQITTGACFGWILLYLCWGASESGLNWFRNEVVPLFFAPHQIIPGFLLLIMTLPILVAGTVASLCYIQTPAAVVTRMNMNNNNNSNGSSSSSSLTESREPPTPTTAHTPASNSSGLNPSPSPMLHPLQQEEEDEEKQLPSPIMEASELFPAPTNRPFGFHWVTACGRAVCRTWTSVALVCGGCRGGPLDDRILFVVFFLLPVSVYAITGSEFVPSLKHVANVCGFVAFIAMNALLIPVARYSPLLLVLGWPPSRAVMFHRWIGWVAMVGVLLHGGLYTYRWVLFRREEQNAAAAEEDESNEMSRHFLIITSIWNRVTIPTECWKDWTGWEGTCVECSCNDYLQNMMGYLAAIMFVVMAVFSLEIVRRRWYHWFYGVHIVTAPLGMFFAILHWHGAMLTLAGGILYYLASSMPVLLSSSFLSTTWNMMGNNNNNRHVSLVSAERLLDRDEEQEEADQQRCCVSFTFEVTSTALERFRPGQYLRLWVPEIAKEAHPFTVVPMPRNQPPKRRDMIHHNHHPSHQQQMRIIFRETGRFTKDLGKFLFTSTAAAAEEPLELFLDGFHGSPTDDWLHQFQQQDHVLIFAGGVGVTPYLALLQELYKHNHDNATASSSFRMMKPKVVHLHWICRDRGLIHYMQREYLNHLCSGDGAEFEISCTIYYTGRLAFDPCWFNNNDSSGERIDSIPSSLRPQKKQYDTDPTAEPFHPSKFAVGSKSTYVGNLPTVTSFVLIGGLGVVAITVFYIRWTWGSSVLITKPLLSCCCVFLISVLAGFLTNLFVPESIGKPYSILNPEDDDEADQGDVVGAPTYSGVENGDANEDNCARVLNHASSSTTSQETAGSFLSSSSSVEKDSAPSARRDVRLVSGRPNIEEIVANPKFQEARLRAVFVCGPTSLVQSARRAARRSGTWCGCGNGTSFYEEVFEM